MKRNKMIKVCAVMALASCFTAGLGVVAASANESSYTSSTQMTFGGAATKIVSDLKDSGLAFKYELNTSLFANTAKGEVAFATGASAGIIVCPEALPADFDVTDETTYGAAKKFSIAAEYWGLNADESKMQGFAYLYNIPNVEYDTEVTAIGYVTTSAGTEYTAAETRSMAYVAYEAIKDESDEAPTADQKLLLDGFLPNYTVTFKVDGETYGAAQTVKYGDKATAPAEAPEKAGYTFNKWVVGNADFDATKGITATTEVTASFTQDLAYVANAKVAKAAGTEIALDGKTNDLGIVYSDAATEVAYEVKKSVGVGTTYGSATVDVSSGKFTVEAGCLYDVNITVNGETKKYVRVYDDNMIIIDDGNSGFYNGGTRIVNSVADEFGKVSYQIDSSKSSLGTLGVNVGALRIYGNENGMVAGATYKVYVDITHSWDASQNDTWVFQKSNSEYLNVHTTRRCFELADISGGGLTLYTAPFTAARLGKITDDRTVTFSNVVIVPEYIKTDVSKVAKAAGTEITLDGTTNGLGVEFYNSVASVSYEVKKTVGNSTTMGTTAVDLSSNKFTVEAGCFYDVNMTLTTKDGRTMKKYVCVHDESIIVVDSDVQTGLYNGSAQMSKTVQDEYGKTSYLVDSSAASNGNLTGNVGAFRIYNNGLAKKTQYVVYFDVVHSWGDPGNTSWVFQHSTAGYITTNKRVSITMSTGWDISDSSNTIYTIQFTAAMMSRFTEDRTMTIGNVVIVPVA